MTAQPFKTIVLDLLQQGHGDLAAFAQELNETERAAIGTPHLWSAKDHLAHRIFWHRDLIQKLSAVLQDQEVPSNPHSDDEINAVVFEENKLRPWSEVYAEAEQVYAELIALARQLSEADLTGTDRFTAITGEHPLYTTFLGSCYEHDQEHLAQYFADRHDLARATQIREKCAARILQAEVPEWVKGWFLYNLASFYAQQNQLEKAAAVLQEAWVFSPRLKESAKKDPQLAALRDILTE